MRSEDRWLDVLRVIHMARSKAGYVNKTRLQKLVYFAQEIGQLPTNYSYAIDYYGPFSRELAGDMSFLEAAGYIRYLPKASGAQEIRLAEEEEQALGNGATQPAEGRPYADVIGQLAGRPAKELGLLATVHFVYQSGGQDREQVVDLVAGLKTVSREEIGGAYDELQEWEWI